MEPWASSNKHRPEDSKASTEPPKERPDQLAGGILLGASVLVLLALMGQTSRERLSTAPVATVAAPKVKHEPDPFIGYVPVKEIEPLKVKTKPTRDRRAVVRAIFVGLAVLFATVLLLTLAEPLLAR